MDKLKVVFFGTPDFSVPSLEMLQNIPNLSVEAVVSMPDRPAGRGQQLSSPPVVSFARDHNLKVFQCQNANQDIDFLNWLDNSKIDCFIVLAFAQFLGKRLLEHPRFGCYNIHTSLLPKYRGAAPIQYALLNGDKITGVSIQKMVKKMDAGDLVHSHELTISPEETGGQLYTRLKFQAALALNDFILKLNTDRLDLVVQDESAVSFAPTLTKDEGFLDFATLTTNDAINKIRALQPWPGTFCFLNNKRLKIFGARLESFKVASGNTHTEYNNLLTGCLDGTLRLYDIQLAGKKRCTDTDLLNGLKNSQKNIIINPKSE